jgi:hypothetical protein
VASSTARRWVSKLSTVLLRRACSLSVACAVSLSFQKSGWPATPSSSAIFERLPSMSKMPPENVEAALQLDETLSQGTDFHGAET